MYLFIDTETGGLDSENSSLLTAAFLVVDEDGNSVEELDLKLSPEDRVYQVHPKAMAVNKINLDHHDREALPYKDARAKVESFLHRNSSRGRLIPIGWNIHFDLDFLHRYLLNKQSWEKWVSYRKLDLCGIGRFLHLCGAVPMSGGLSDVARSFDIDVTGHHNALYDARLTLKVFQRYRDALSEALSLHC